MAATHAHYLRRLVAARWPRRMIYLDAEAYHLPGGRFLFMVAAAIADDRDTAGELAAGYTDSADAVLEDAGAVWEWIDHRCGRGETRVWTHGLEFDLAVTRARRHLARLGWEAERFAIRDHAGWWRWRKPGGRLLVLCDSAGFLGNAGLEQVARDLGAEQAPRPSSPLDREGWVRRARGDVWIMREAVRRLLEWQAGEGGGGPMLTGSAQGMALYRRRFLPERELLVHDDQAAGDAERDATWAGRCEAWRWGRVDGPLEEWDYEQCYPRLAALGVPVCLSRASRRPGEGYTRLARVEATTALPVAPMDGGDRGVVYPVGRFETTLWEPELELLEETGGGYRVLEEWWYRLGDPLSAWSAWVCDQALDHPSPLVRRVAKQWSRTVIGSFGLRYQAWVPFSDDPGLEATGDTIAVVPMGVGGAESSLLYLAGQVYERGELEEGDNAMPQVQGYVWSLARVALWRAMVRAGLEHVVYVDTDSLIVTAEGARRLARWRLPGGGPRLRLKGRYSWIDVYGSRRLIIGDQAEDAGSPRVSGLKRGARQVAPATWEAEVWETGLAGGLGGLEEYRARVRTFNLVLGELRRDREAGGQTRPVRA